MTLTNLAYEHTHNRDNISKFPLNYITEHFEAFLSSKSKNTVDNYKPEIELYFKITLEKEIGFVTIEDVIGTTSLHAHKYYNYLKTEGNKGKGYKNASIKSKINAVRSFYKHLVVDYKDVNPFIFNNITLDSPDLDRESWGEFEWQEAIDMWDYALENQIEGNQMGMLVKLAAITSIRLEALLNLRWDKHFFKTKKSGVLVNYIETIDKKQKHKKPISDDFYNELQEKLGVTGKLFPNLHQHKVGDFIDDMVKHFNLDPKRLLVFHSLKKAGVNRVLRAYR